MKHGSLLGRKRSFWVGEGRETQVTKLLMQVFRVSSVFRPWLKTDFEVKCDQRYGPKPAMEHGEIINALQECSLVEIGDLVGTSFAFESAPWMKNRPWPKSSCISMWVFC